MLVGGRAIRDAEHAAELGADAYAADGRGVVALVDELVRGASRQAHGGDVA